MFAGTVPPPRDAIWTWKGVHLFTSAVKPFFCRLAIEGRENIPATGGCVLTCNHTMGPDFLVIGYLSPRQIHFMVKAEIMDKYRRLGQFLEKRRFLGTGDDHVAAILERGGEAIDFLPAKRSVDLDGRPQFEGFGQGGAIQGNGTVAVAQLQRFVLDGHVGVEVLVRNLMVVKPPFL